MEKIPYTVRLDSELLNQVKDRAEKEGETVTAMFEQALKSFLSSSGSVSDKDTDREEITTLTARIKRLETIVLDKQPQTEGELLTIKQISEITGYTVNTLSGKMSRLNIQAVDRVNGNRAGLYDRKEVMEKIGMNEK